MTIMPCNKTAVSAMPASWRAAALATLTGAAILAPGLARADMAPAQGTSVEGVATVQRMQIPLPGGEWVWAGRSFTQLEALEGVAYGTIEGDVLLSVKNGSVNAFVFIYRNAIPVENGWGSTDDCSKDGLLPPTDYVMSESHIFCSFIQRVRVAEGAATGADAAWKDALRYAEEQHLKVPSDWYMVGFRKADRREMLDVRYHFAVADLPGTPAVETRLLEQWRDTIRGPVRWGFDGELPSSFTVAMPGTLGVDEPSPEMDLKLGLLNDLHARKVVGDIDFRRQRAAILATQVKLQEKKVSNEELTMWKTIADQVSAGAANFVIDYGVLQNPISAAGLFSVQRVFDMFQYSSHEWAWNTWGPRGLSEPPAIELPGAGSEEAGTGKSPPRHAPAKTGTPMVQSGN
jgi:hypothetical protein